MVPYLNRLSDLLHPVARGERDRGARRAALEARRNTLTVFGGGAPPRSDVVRRPIAHVGYFRDEYVRAGAIADEGVLGVAP